MMSTPEHIEYDVNHYFKNSDSIFKYTKWNIPPFDTVTASYEDFFLDGGVEEKIRLRKNLDSNNTKELENLCINDSLWKETDSTFFFRGRFSYYDYLDVSVSKRNKDIVISYGSY